MGILVQHFERMQTALGKHGIIISRCAQLYCDFGFRRALIDFLARTARVESVDSVM